MTAASLSLEAAASCSSRSRRPINGHLLLVQQVRHAALTVGVEAALELLRAAPLRVAPRTIVDRALAACEIQLLIASGHVREARRLVDSVRDPLPAARLDVLLAEGDVPQARRVLEAWEPPTSDVRAVLERDLRAAVIAKQEERPGTAGTLVAEAATRADAEGLLGSFLDAPLALSLLRTAAPVRRLRRVRALVDGGWSTGLMGSASNQLIDQLTPREAIVLEYLPSRLSNEQIAQTLYVSVNTLKTHLRNIYRKLDVPGRDAAVDRATSLGLI